jgi:apolipoprotein D and lipocalin family protein
MVGLLLGYLLPCFAMRTVAVISMAVCVAAALFPPATAMLSTDARADMIAARRAARNQATITGFPTTVSALNTSAFLGRWYEVYQDLITAATFQQNSFCATADYGVDLAKPGNITVVNRERYGSISGPERNVSGYAYQPDPQGEPGQLVVMLHGDNASPFPAPYWILKLGPINNESAHYEYAVVSDMFRLTLFVLARDVAHFHAFHEQDVLSWLAGNGFDQWWNKPILLLQDNCTYVTPSSAS